MAKDETLTDKIRRLAVDPKHIRNLCIAAHIDHGKTTLTDNLLAGAGMLSEDLAGKVCKMDFDKQEQERGITIYSANVSMVHDFEGEEYLINLIDTPGHVDFGGDVTRAMRAVDGAVVVCCAVEGIMPQTETVLRQALKEKVKPVLFINKVDRLIRELQLGPEQMQERFMKIILKVNNFIEKNAPREFKDAWKVDVNAGSVGFGSAYKNWAISVPYMKKTGITFKEIIERTNQGGEAEKELAKKAPLHGIILNMAVRHLPTPLEAQKYRIPKLWSGDIESEAGKDMLACNPNGKLAGVITNVTADQHAGLISTVRLFSGTIHDGDEVYLVGAGQSARAQQVSVYNGPKRTQMQSIPCGNIIGLSGIGMASSGETMCTPDNIIAPFESIKHAFEPVVTKSIEVVNVQDLPKVIMLLRQRAKEDQTIKIKISEDTGEMLVSGLGELHIDAKVERYIKDKGVKIKVSKPIVIYKEGVLGASQEVEGKSPNKHNRFYMKVEKPSDAVSKLLLSGDLPEKKMRKQEQDVIIPAMVEAGMDREEAKKIVELFNGNMLVNGTKGIQYLNEVMELIKQSFEEVCNNGPLAEEPVTGMKVTLMDAKLHEDAIHRGPAQILPAVKMAIKNAMLLADASVLEPKQIIRLDMPTDRMGDVMGEVQNRRGTVLEMSDEGDTAVLNVKLPVAEMFGFEAGLKSATGGRGFQSLVDIVYEFMPRELQNATVLSVRKRKGLKEELPKPEFD